MKRCINDVCKIHCTTVQKLREHIIVLLSRSVLLQEAARFRRVRVILSSKMKTKPSPI